MIMVGPFLVMVASPLSERSTLTNGRAVRRTNRQSAAMRIESSNPVRSELSTVGLRCTVMAASIGVSAPMRIASTRKALKAAR